MKFSDFWRGYSGGKTPHREQQRYIAAVDAGTYPENLLHWSKKCAKSFTAAMRALHYLVAEERDPDDREIAIGSNDEEQSKIIFAQVAQLVARHEWLSARVKVNRSEMIFTEEARDVRTGGTFTRSHRLRALPRDAKGLHGEPWSLVCRDELWAEPDHAMTEALIPSPARPYSEILYTTYSTLATMRKPGVPFHDLMVRVAAQDPTLFYSYIGGQGEDASWRVCPWVSEAWVDQQRRMFAASPSRFKRVVLNEQVLGGEGDTLLTIEEIQAAIDRTLPATPAERLGRRHVGGLDLGVSNDHAVLTIGHLDPRGRFELDVCQVWKPTNGQPIAFTEILDAVVAWHRRLPLATLDVDQWNAKLLVELLERAHIPARMVGVEQTRLNQIITVLKSAFARRAIRIRPSETYLLEQLEALRTLETRTPRRDLLKFVPSGTGLDASAHDDAAVSLGLCLTSDSVRDRIGRVSMDEITCCQLAANGHLASPAACFLAGGSFLPVGDPACRACVAYQSTRDAHRAFVEVGGAPTDIREFVRSGLIAPCTYMSTVKAQRTARNFL